MKAKNPDLRVRCDVDARSQEATRVHSLRMIPWFDTGQVQFLIEPETAETAPFMSVVPSRRDLRRLHVFVGKMLQTKRAPRTRASKMRVFPNTIRGFDERAAARRKR